MNNLEIVNAKDKFIRDLKSLPHKEIIEFLNFNRYHHKRPFQEILSLFVQAPDARYVSPFEFWKDFTEETQAQFNQKEAINIFDTNGNLLEQLFDIAQVELSSIPEINNIVLTEEVRTLIDHFIDEKCKSIKHSEHNTIILLLKYNLYEELGILLNNDQDYHVLLNDLIYALKTSIDKIVEVFSTVNKLTTSLSRQIQNNYKEHLYF
ncbi:hypothetical protein ACI1TW_09995 [Lactococcus garvieae]|uniref:hypothetical protein n=1 Tax=Lactococcus garvieae TaxID=1363 RepID=UPI003853410A